MYSSRKSEIVPIVRKISTAGTYRRQVNGIRLTDSPRNDDISLEPHAYVDQNPHRRQQPARAPPLPFHRMSHGTTTFRINMLNTGMPAVLSQ